MYVARRNTFRMSCIDNFSQWNQFDRKSQRENRTEMKFPIVNHKMRKKRLLRYSFTLSVNG